MVYITHFSCPSLIVIVTSPGPFMYVSEVLLFLETLHSQRGGYHGFSELQRSRHMQVSYCSSTGGQHYSSRFSSPPSFQEEREQSTSCKPRLARIGGGHDFTVAALHSQFLASTACMGSRCEAVYYKRISGLIAWNHQKLTTASNCMELQVSRVLVF